MAHLKAINDSFSYNLSEDLKISGICGIKILLMFFIYFFLMCLLFIQHHILMVYVK